MPLPGWGEAAPCWVLPSEAYFLPLLLPHAVEKYPPPPASLPLLMQGPFSLRLWGDTTLPYTLSEIPYADHLWPSSQLAVRQRKKAAQENPRI